MLSGEIPPGDAASASSMTPSIEQLRVEQTFEDDEELEDRHLNSSETPCFTRYATPPELQEDST